jgi:hypothetical protein
MPRPSIRLYFRRARPAGIHRSCRFGGIHRYAAVFTPCDCRAALCHSQDADQAAVHEPLSPWVEACDLRAPTRLDRRSLLRLTERVQSVHRDAVLARAAQEFVRGSVGSANGTIPTLCHDRTLGSEFGGDQPAQAVLRLSSCAGRHPRQHWKNMPPEAVSPRRRAALRLA